MKSNEWKNIRSMTATNKLDLSSMILLSLKKKINTI